jgi:hypothetical protein
MRVGTWSLEFKAIRSKDSKVIKNLTSRRDRQKVGKLGVTRVFVLKRS